MTLDRRQALALLAAGVVPARLAQAQHQHEAAQASRQANAQPYRPQFFTAEEHRFLDRVTEMILPADAHSPGASAAGVADFIDLVAANSSPVAQHQWQVSIQSLGGVTAFLALDAAAQKAVLEKAAAGEQSPANDAEQFFVDLKRMTLHAYYTSEIGVRKELGYLGPQALGSFPGCQA